MNLARAALKKTTLMQLATAAWLLVAVIGFAWWTNRFFPLDQWLAFFWLRAWAGALLFGISSLAAGTRLVELFRLPFGTVGERFTIAFALGVLTFALGIFLVGCVGLLGAPFFYLWPLALLLAGRRTLARQCRHLASALSRAGSRALLPATRWQAIALSFLLVGTLGIYLQVLTPANISYDARWYHLPIAEGYAATGWIRPFPEGWYLAAYPHLASWLYAWAFLAPGAVRHHLCLVMHVEFVIFLAMIPGAAALARRLVGRPRLWGASGAIFLFPTLFTYGPNLNGGADHVMGLWAAPIGLVLLRYLARPALGAATLLGAFLGAAALTKYQAIYWVPGIVLVVVVHAVRARSARPALLAGATALVVSAPFWLKNLIAYGDPFYPNLHNHLGVHPFFSGAGEMMKQYYLAGSGGRTVVERLRDAPLNALIFSFAPKLWGGVGRGGPAFGSLFTLLTPLAFVVRPRRRLLIVAACLYLSLMTWDFIYAEDRYLQTVFAWMAAFVAAILAASWHMGSRLVRIALVLLVGLQLAWRSDTFFFRNHGMIGDAPIKAFVDYLSPTGEKPDSDRRYPGEELAAIGAALPRGAHVVAHDFDQSMGAGIWPIIDNPWWEGGLEYLQTDTPEQTVTTLRRFGATHVLWPEHTPRVPEDMGRDAVLARTTSTYGEPPLHVAGFEIVPLRPASADSHQAADRQLAASPTRIAWLTCGTNRALGVYTPIGLGSGSPVAPLDAKALKANPGATLAVANVALTRGGCADADAASGVLSTQFTAVMVESDTTLWVRLRLP